VDAGMNKNEWAPAGVYPCGNRGGNDRIKYIILCLT